MSKHKSELVLGYTRTGLPVLLPTSKSPDLTRLVNWTRGDHVDAARIFAEHSEREPDPKAAEWCVHWAKTHKKMKKSNVLHVRGAAETSLGMKRR